MKRFLGVTTGLWLLCAPCQRLAAQTPRENPQPAQPPPRSDTGAMPGSLLGQPTAQAVGGQTPVRMLDLATALEISTQHAPELREAAAASAAARARVESQSSPLLPQVIGTASFVRGTANQPYVPFSWHGNNEFAAGLRATQLIYDFGQAWNVRVAALRNASATEYSERATQLQITYNVRSSFLTAAADKALIRVQRATLANQQRHLEQIQGFVEVGTRAQIDLAQARTDVASAQLALLRAMNAYEGAKAQLSRDMGTPHETNYDVSEELPPAEDGEAENIDALMHVGEHDRPEFASMRAQYQAEGAVLTSIKGQYGPTLNAVASLDENGYSLSHMATNLTAGLTLIWPIFQGGLTNGRVDETHALIAQLGAQLDALRQDLRLALTQAQLAIKAAQAELATAEDLVKLAQAQLALAEARYATGVGSIIELGDAELSLRDAETQHVTAQYDLAQARALLRRSLGRF